MEIRNKTEFFRLWKAGVLGNRTQLWDHPFDAYMSGVPEVGFREQGKGGGGAWAKVPRGMVYLTAFEWQQLGRKFTMDDGAPDLYRTMQGEVCRTYRGMEGYLEVGGHLPMRKAMAAGLMQPCSYAQVVDLLNRFMDPSSREDMDALLELFPDATVEFSCFSKDVGVFPGRNTMFWECRNY